MNEAVHLRINQINKLIIPHTRQICIFLFAIAILCIFALLENTYRKNILIRETQNYYLISRSNTIKKVEGLKKLSRKNSIYTTLGVLELSHYSLIKKDYDRTLRCYQNLLRGKKISNEQRSYIELMKIKTNVFLEKICVNEAKKLFHEHIKQYRFLRSITRLYLASLYINTDEIILANDQLNYIVTNDNIEYQQITNIACLLKKLIN